MYQLYYRYTSNPAVKHIGVDRFTTVETAEIAARAAVAKEPTRFVEVGVVLVVGYVKPTTFIRV